MSLPCRTTALLLTWSVFFALAIGSKSYDPDEEIIREPVDYSISIINVGTIELENGDTTDTVTDLTLNGTLNQAAGSAPTLRSGDVSFVTSSSFNVNAQPTDPDNTLRGEIQVSVSDALTFNDNRTIQTGQLSVFFGGTSTLITFPGDSNDVRVETGSNDAITITLSELRTQFDDEDENINTRAASKAWATFENLWLTARISETIHREIDEQLNMLTSIGRNQPLTLECDNPSATPTPERTLIWVTDAEGTGSGEASNNDSFDSVYRNCSFTSNDRFLQGELTMANYIFFNTDEQSRQMSFDAELSNLFIAEENIETSTVALTRERIDGTLRINVLEPESTP